MTVSMRVMSAGDGYKYLLRTVATGGGNRALSTPLTRYYNAEGTPPGRWMGSGLPALGTGQVTSGDEVSEAQLQLLVAMGRDLIEARADAVLDNALAGAAQWTAELGPRPTDVEKLATWRHSARVVAAYRDRYQVIIEAAIGTQAETIGQKIDAARAQAALDPVRRLAASSMPMEKVQTAAPSSGRFL